MAEILLIKILGSIFFSTGLSSRIELDKLPDLYNGKDGPGITGNPDIPNGTFPGLILASSIIVINNLIRSEKKTVKLIQKLTNSFAVGGLIFAVGATNLDIIKKRQDKS